MVWREGMPAWSTLRDVPELWAVFAERLVEMPQLVVEAPPASPEEVALAGAVPQTPILAHPGPGTLDYARPDIKPASGAAITSLVTGIGGLLWWCLPGSLLVAVPLSILAIVFAVIARKKARQGSAGGDGMALGGLILGIFNLLLALAITAIVGGFMVALWRATTKPATQPATPTTNIMQVEHPTTSPSDD